MNKYKVVTNDGEVEVEADCAYIGGIGNTLTFTNKGEWHEPNAAPMFGRRNDPLEQFPALGYIETLYVAAFNGNYWKSYVQINDVPVE